MNPSHRSSASPAPAARSTPCGCSKCCCAAGRDVHLSISPSGRDVIRQELKLDIDLDHFDASQLASSQRKQGSQKRSPGELHYYHHQDFMAPMASGSFLTGGMVICPCSGTTLSAVATGAAGNLIQRAAEVHLKERRKLILVPRETPLSLAHIDNMRRVTEAGAVVLPASPGWYHGVESRRATWSTSSSPASATNSASNTHSRNAGEQNDQHAQSAQRTQRRRSSNHSNLRIAHEHRVRHRNRCSRPSATSSN